MSIYNFNIGNKSKSKFNISAKAKLNKGKYNVIESKAVGVCCLDNKGIYYVAVYNGDKFRKYPIHKDCYSCKGFTHVIFQAHPTIVKVVKIRFEQDKGKDNKFCLPFFPGVICFGDIVEDKGVRYFIVTKNDVINETNESINLQSYSKEYFMFYKENKEKLDSLIIKNINENRV